MARLQILELPEGAGVDRPPFVLVVDQCVPQRIALGQDATYRDYWQDLAQQIGARGVIVTPETVDIPANEVPLDENGKPLFLKVHVQGEFEQFRADVQDEIRKAQNNLAAARGGDQATQYATEVEQLRAGEESYIDERIVPTPGQWIWKWNRATPEKRLSMAKQILDAMPRANDCFMADHEAQIATLRAELAQLRAEPSATEKPDA